MGHLNGCRYLLHDRDTKFCPEFRGTLAAGGVKGLRLPPRSPNLNAFAEHWVRSVKEEYLSHLILFGERSLSKFHLRETMYLQLRFEGFNITNRVGFSAPVSLSPTSASFGEITTQASTPRRVQIGLRVVW